MKGKLRNLLLAATAVMLFAGCSNIGSNDADVSGEGIRDGECLLTVGVEGATGAYNARTINPTTVYDNDSAFKRLVLTGDSAKGLTVEHVFTEAELTAKQAEISLAYDKWYLTLTAYDGETVASSVAVLSGNYFVDLTKAKPASIGFTLTPDEVTTAGSISFTGKLIDPAFNKTTDTDSMRIVKAKAALYSIEKDTVIAGTASTVNVTTIEGVESNTVPSRTFTYTANNVAPGRYIFKVTFISVQGSGDSATETEMGYYSDVIVVAPGRATTATNVTIPDVIGKKPVKPTNLKVFYVDGSDSDGYYTAKVEWSDNSSNEESFILKVFEYDAWGDTDASATTILGSEDDSANNKYVFWTSSLRKSGTLGSSTDECELKLAAGKVYNFAIAATNKFGTSDFETRSPCVATDDVAAVAGTSPALYGFRAAQVARVKIAYNLAGGKLELSATESYEGTYVVYETYTGSAITLQAGNPASGATYPKLERSHNPFVDWKDAAENTVSTLDEVKNLSVVASYNPKFIVSYVVEESYGELPADALTAEADRNNTDNNTECINKTFHNNPKFTFTVTGAEEIKVIIGNNAPRAATGNTITLDTKGTGANAMETLDAGTYAVTVLAKVQLDGETEAKWYSRVFAITIEK